MADNKARFTVAVPQPKQDQQSGGSQFNLAAETYSYEREALDRIGAEIVEIPAETDADFVAGAKNAEAVIARGRRISAEIIAGLDNVVVIGCGSVGTDTVDVDAATAAGIPPTCPTSSSKRSPTTPWRSCWPRNDASTKSAR